MAHASRPAIPVSADRSLRVLHLEDSALDHELVVAYLRHAGLTPWLLRVDTEADYRHALAHEDWDLVLSDFKLPGFTGLQALQILKDSGLQLPFVLVSGEIGEDMAVAAMRNGASDYLLKNNLARLAPAVEHAIAANRERVARQRADRDLASSRQRLAELAQHLQTSIEAERAAIAREIHDDVGASLTAIKFDLAWIGRHVESPEVQQRLSAALETVAHAVEASQRIMHNLRPAILEQGLVAALQWMAGRFGKREGLVCNFRSSHDNLQLPTGVPLVVYRFAQEALTNVSKHARATKVLIDLSLSGGVLSLEVSDNGRGLGADDATKAGGFGLRGLHERARHVGGWVEVSSSTAGTVLLLSVPIDPTLVDASSVDTPGAVDGHPSSWDAA